MNEQTLFRLNQFIANRDKVKNVFAWDNRLIHLACAGIYVTKDMDANEKSLQYARQLIKNNAGIFSNFRGNARAPVATMIAMSNNPEQELEKSLKVYGMLKQSFFASSYLPLVALLIVQMAEEYDYERICLKARNIYDGMKQDHPFLTHSEDSAFCALMALSEKSEQVLLQEAESCYQMLKQEFHSANAVQSLSHVLALCDGTPESKCKRTIEMYAKLKAAGCKYGTSYELPTLGTLAMANESMDELVTSITEADQWLSGQKGFGFWSGVSKKQRLMYAGMIAQQEYYQGDTLRTAAVNGTISMIIAQQAAICAAVSASAAASSASSSSSC